MGDSARHAGSSREMRKTCDKDNLDHATNKGRNNTQCTKVSTSVGKKTRAFKEQMIFSSRSQNRSCQSVKIAQPAHSNASRAPLTMPTQHGTQLECRHQRRLRERAPRVRGQRLARMQSAKTTACAMLVQNGGATSLLPRFGPGKLTHE